MIRILRHTISWLQWIPFGQSPRTRTATITFASAVMLAVLSSAHATDPPVPAVSDRMSALPNVGLTQSAVSTPSSSASGTLQSQDSNSSSGSTYGLVPSTPMCGEEWKRGDDGVYRPASTYAPIYLREGAPIEQAVDVRVPGPVSDWALVRSYNSRIQGQEMWGGTWLSDNTDYRLVQDGMYDVTLIVDATSKRAFEDIYGSDLYYSPGDATISLQHDQTNSQYIVTNWSTGEVNIFEDFYMYATHPGKLKEKTTLAWQEAGLTGMQYTYNGSHQLTQITTGAGQEYVIAFSYTGSKITKIEVRTGANTSTRVRQVEYTYFASGTHSADVGDDGDLVQVTGSELKTGGDVDTAADWIVRIMQYRYDSNGMLKAVFEPDAVQGLIYDRSDVDDADDILALGDDDDDSGAEDHKIKEYASRRFTYYTVDVKTDNSGAGTSGDPKCVTTWSASGEDLETTYGGSDTDEVDASEGMYLVKSEIIGGCAGCGGGSGSITREYFYMELDHGTPDPNEVVWLVVEDTIDSDDNGVDRKVYGLSDSGRRLREVTITDPTGSPDFTCRSWKLETDTGDKLNRLTEVRLPEDHNVTSSTVDEFLNPSHNGSFTNDTSTLNASSGATRTYEYNSSGGQTGVLIKQGSSGTEYYLSASDYLGGSNENRKHLVTARYIFPEETTSRTAASRIATTYAHTFWTDTDVVKKRTATLPSISSGENGSGSSTTTEEYYDDRGRLRWQKDAAGFVNYYSYHPENGRLAYTVKDADPTSLPSSADDNDTKWVTSLNGSASSNKPSRATTLPSGATLPTAVEQVTWHEFDSRTRSTLTAQEDGTGTVLARHHMVYETSRQLSFAYWDTTEDEPLLPIQVTVFDNGGTVTEHYSVDPARAAATSHVPTGLSSGTDQSHYFSWSRNTYDYVSGNLTKVHRYHDIPSSGYGTKDTNYAETVYGHDSEGRRDRVVSPGGTISRSVFDGAGRMASQWVGTDDTPSSGDWSPTNNSGANMTKVAQFEYDDGDDGGNGNRTKVVRYLTDDVEANARVTEFKYDWRNRQVFIVDSQEFSSKVTYSRVELDNLGRTTKSERYYDADDDESFPTDGTVDGGDRLLARSESLYDDFGRSYRTKTYAVDPDDGTVGSALVGDSWFDPVGRTLKRQSGGSEAFSKMVYDGLGRVTEQYAGYDTDETTYNDADDVTGDTILQQTEIDHNASGNVIQATSYARKHTASGTGALTTSTARVTYTASWFDDAGRQTASANYGTNGGSAFTRPSTAPSRSDTIMVNSTEYNSTGQAYKTTDPAGKESRRYFDDAGRATKTIDNYVDGTPGSSSDEDVTVEMEYNIDGKLKTLTAKNPTTGDQETKYVYGTDVGTGTPEIYRNDLLRAEIYPDSDDTTALANGADGNYDRIEYTYNIQGNRLTRKGQNESVHTYVHDDAGRVTHDRVTTLGSGVDGEVRRVSTTYDIRGLREKITSYDNATVGSGSAVNELVFEYNDTGQPTKEYQEHEGAKDANTLYVQYNYDTTTASGEFTKGLRKTSVRYPSSRLVHWTYGSSGSTADVMNRVDAIKADSGGSPGTTLSEYTYLGGGRIVVEDFSEPDVKLNYDSGTAGTYAGFDRFGRVVDHLWRDYGASTDRDRFTYGYDRASSRLYREHTLASGQDDFYTYDDVNRLATFDRGDLNANKDAISGTAAKEEDWGLDMTGNWTDFTQKTSGSTDLNQDRTHNDVNEITAISETTGTAWIDPVHDHAGNMTTVPKPSSLSSGLTCKYDAWNHLVEVKDGATVVAVYEYDGLARRIKKHLDSQSPGSPNGIDAYVHFLYNGAWQVLETRDSTTENTGPESLQPEYQYVWSQRYIDAPVLRDENTDGDGTCDDDRIYYLGDANFNITTLVDSSGDALERYVYSPYGVLTIYDATWSNIRSDSSHDVEYTYTGRRLDLETGLFYYRHRVYAAEVGRFISRDPIGYSGSKWNLYCYVQDRPTQLMDPKGTYIWPDPPVPPVDLSRVFMWATCHCNWRTWSYGFWYAGGGMHCTREFIQTINDECCEDCCGRFSVCGSSSLNVCMNACVPETVIASGRCRWIW